MIQILTLGANNYDRGVCAVYTQLAVELVELLERGLILQTEYKDYSIDPAAELQVEDDI